MAKTKHPLIVVIRPDGARRTIFHPNQRNTISDVVCGDGDIVEDAPGLILHPENPFLDRVYQWIRRTFGRDSLMANFTRRWKCKFDVLNQAGKHLQTCDGYAHALAYEVNYLQEQFTDKGV